MFKKWFYVFLIIFVVSATGWAASQQESSTTAATVIKTARYYLNEPSPMVWADAELAHWINDAQMDIVSRTQCKEETETKTLTANTYTYSITTNYISAEAAVYSPGAGTSKIGLLRGHPSHVGHSGSTSAPTYWFEHAGNVTFYPVKTSVDATDSVIVYLVATPTAVTEASPYTSLLDIPRIYDKAVALYVASQALKKTGQFAKANSLMIEYLAELERYRQDYVVREKEPVAKIKNQ